MREPKSCDFTSMQFVVDFLPLLAFAVAYWLADMHTAILAIMVAISLQVLVTWIVTRTVSRMLMASAVLVVVLGGISLILNNDLIFKWKPTVLNWAFALVFFGSRYIGDRPIAQRILESVSKDEFQLTQADWRRLNLMWVAFFLVSGAANIFVAYSFPEAVWVKFKLFGLTGMTLAFALLQGLWLSKRTPDEH
jgi:intracellular septation protein